MKIDLKWNTDIAVEIAGRAHMPVVRHLWIWGPVQVERNPPYENFAIITIKAFGRQERETWRLITHPKRVVPIAWTSKEVHVFCSYPARLM
jgi:hypothetical protein